MTIDAVTIQRDLQGERRVAAAAFRQELSSRGILCINVISSPGAGKTTLLQSTARAWPERGRLAVLVGDIATDRDAERLAPYVPVKQLTTGGACHLELPLIKTGLQSLDLAGVEYLFIENVGNLVCPASHDLGEHLRVVVLSVTEGDDKPGKYPKAFRTSHACIVSKLDLQPYVPFSMSKATEDAHRIQPEMPFFPMSALHGIGVDAWCDYLRKQRELRLAGGVLT